ncbi:hypothetical protein ACQKPE_10095 [Pseudomonas sp. NPDC089554]|uniref:hypothetical protein n=1 Tax=Pseudomonas sp. NPDC089554 TaxID=3390653 RepID=UPI003D0031B8
MAVETPTPWLAPLLQVLHETQARASCSRLEHALQRLDPGARWRLLHRWHAETVLPVLAAALPRQGQAAATLQRLHQRAALGLAGRSGEWRMALQPVLLATYRQAYAFEAVYAQAYDSAVSYGQAPANLAMIAEQFGDAEAFGRHYAQLSSEANATTFATAHAACATTIAARAYANTDEQAYASIIRPLVRVYRLAGKSPNEQLLAGLHQALARQ